MWLLLWIYMLGHAENQASLEQWEDKRVMFLLAWSGPHLPVHLYISVWSLWATEFEALLWYTELGLIRQDFIRQAMWFKEASN